MNARSRFILAFTVLAIAAAILLPAVPQPIDYHHFADQRPALGIENFLDVVSNLAFALVGIVGLAITLRARTVFAAPIERLPYALFFVGMLLTAAGSGYYHLAPDNASLFWDRLPMTIAFMSLICATIVDRIDVRTGLLLLVPALIVGAASVIYWILTERVGRGNVVPYAVLQAYAVFVMLFLAILQPSRYTHGGQIYWVFAAYVIAKLLEHLDHEVLHLGHFVSGHTLKHFAAAAAGLFVCRMLWQRRLASATA
jgi:hypothetical protein